MPRYQPLPRFVLRSPTLPFAVLAAEGEPAKQRDALRRLVEDPLVREALFVASPELHAQIAAWLADPETASGVAVERALVRYVSRMAGRATPFGLFAAVSVGAIGAPGAATELALPGRGEANRHTRLDNDLLFALCADLVRDPASRARLRYRPNSSLYLAAARLRYAEARLADRSRSYHLVAVDPTSHLDALLDRARGGATRDELIGALCVDPEIGRDEAGAFVDEIIDVQLVVPELAPTVTGREPTDAMIATLETCALDAIAEPLRFARDRLREIDAAAPGVAVEAYRAIERHLADGLPTRVDASRLFQVDLFKPAPAAVLGEAVTGELLRAVETLHAMTPAPGDAWRQFRERFAARYETREVPLLEVLDEETGIGFGPAEAASAPLLAGLAFPVPLGAGDATGTMLGSRDVHLMALVSRALQDGATEIELGDRDVAQLTERSPMPLPGVFGVMAQLEAASSEAIAAGRYQLRVDGVTGGANLLGRFCHGSPDVAALTERCLRAEEAQRPDAVFAEIVHLPEGRIGNILLRPVLRDHEIPYLGASGAERDRQIDVTDLVVSVVGERVVLRSRRLDREVIPRLTAAHNHALPSNLGVYRFLCAHAEQQTGHAHWSWGVLDAMPFLPRVRRGRAIYARARWRLTAADLAPIEAAFHGSNAAKTPEQIRAIRTRVLAAVAELRRRLRLPRWIVVGDSDNELPVDLDNELMVDSAAHLLKGRAEATLVELLPAPDQLCAVSPDGALCHELLVLFATAAGPAPAQLAATTVRDTPVERRFFPGSRWLYLKIYCGHATADAVLRDHLAPIIAAATECSLVDRWFFLRYADPDPHLRLRFSGDPRRLTGELLPALHAALSSARDAGLVWKVAVDSYEREIERYGGPAAIELAEAVFHADSACVLDVLSQLTGDAASDATWRLALHGIDRLMGDLGLTLDDKLAAMTRAATDFGAEMGIDTAFHKRLGEKFRAHHAEIASLLDAPGDHPLAPALASFAARSTHLRAIGEQLRALEATGQLREPVAELVHSYAHMHVNRMIRAAPRLHEVVLYDLLRRHYEGITARRRLARAG